MNATAMTTDAVADRDAGLAATLHVFVAFDWGDEIDLGRARQLFPSETHALPRERRTPPSIEYRPPPIRCRLDPWPVHWNVPVRADGAVTSDATVFDFGAVSVALHVPLALSKHELAALAGSLADGQMLIESARAAAQSLFERLIPAIPRPEWSPLSEEYVVIELRAADDPVPSTQPVDHEARWLAGLVRLESDPLSDSEVAESLKARMSYSPADLVVVDWAGAVMIDQNPGEILDLLSFANLQLLELRQINRQLEAELETAWQISRRHALSWLPFWRTHARQVRALGMVKVDANGMLERTSNILKLVGDPYLARVYQMLVARFRLDEWAANNRRAISVLESVYQVLTQQAATYRAEFLELTIVVLILFEIASQLWK